jgi:hypothetical protein
MLVTLSEILRDADRRHYAVGAFNCLSVENVMGAIHAAEKLRSPIILQLAEVQFPEAPLELMAPVFLQAAHREPRSPCAFILTMDRVWRPACGPSVWASRRSCSTERRCPSMRMWPSRARWRALPRPPAWTWRPNWARWATRASTRPTCSPMSMSRCDLLARRASTPWPSPSATCTATMCIRLR